MSLAVPVAIGSAERAEDAPGSRKRLVQGDLRPKRISHLQFCFFSPAEMQRMAEFQVSSRELFTMPSRQPARGGCLDPRLGVSDKFSSCETCKRKLVDCAGHYGYIKLALPVFHIGFLRHTLHLLQCICKTCSRVLLLESERLKILQKMRNPKTDALAKAAIFKKVVEKAKKARSCPHCQKSNGTVKKVTGAPTLKIVHERFKFKAAEDDREELRNALEAAIKHNKDIATIVDTGTPPVEELLPTRVLELFTRITDDDCEVLWLDPLIGRPENLILQKLLVPPVPIRPSVAMDVGGGSNEDDLTVKLQEIVDVNVALELALNKGPLTRTIVEEWDFLQVQVSQYINGELPGIQRPIGSKPIRGLCQRLKGKQGRFRGNLSGKRVDFSARTVISPDPNLRVDEVGVPKKIAMTMTYPERVSSYNIEKLRERVRNGPDVHPGANMIRLKDGSFVKSLAFGDRNASAKNLRIGDVVERHMEDGDIVLFNRQPSLHKVSIMAHHVKVMEFLTFRFNTCVCAPYNADFDGDEMNMHLPQTEEARTEARLLMGVEQNLTTPRNGEPLVAASQDFLSAAYLLTQRNVFYTRQQFCQLVAYYSDAEEHIDLPPPAIIKPRELWTGKQVFSMLLVPNRQDLSMTVSFENKEKNYSTDKHFCPKDGWVCVLKGELISGNIAKKAIGEGSKAGLLFVVLRDVGSDAAARIMNRWAKFCGRFMGAHKGLSIGISDVTPSRHLRDIKDRILSEGYKKAAESIDAYEKGALELRPGCDLLQSLEEILNGILGRLRESAGQAAMKALPWSNTPRIMADCGSKGSPLNISQMIAMVGQQAVGGRRIENGFVDRTLPHFEHHSLTPSAKGFVANSFYSGLTATEFFFHAMGGREGLVDTAVKTAETGYMARRLMKALEDLSLQYDCSVRNSENTVVQFVYGDDGLNPQSMEDNDRPVDFARVRLHVTEHFPCIDEKGLSASKLTDSVERHLSEERFQSLPTGQVFLNDVRNFFANLADQWRALSAENLAGSESMEVRAWNSCRVTPTQLEKILDIALSKFRVAYVEPGEACGAIGAQSISEPGTQMTLKTFHFSGISSMNVTLGVPRLKEIINAAKMISTPIITGKLEQNNNKVAARLCKAVIEKTTLGQVAKYMKEVYSPESCYISIELDMEAIDHLKLNVDAHSVRRVLLYGIRGVTKNSTLRAIKEHQVLIKRGSTSKLRVLVPSEDDIKSKPYFALQMLKAALPDVIVQGIPSIQRAVINESEKGETPTYNLLMEGYGLQEVMGSPGIDGLQTTTNHVLEVESVLGVEAARTQISAEIENIMNAYGIGIDRRHLLLLSDVMTFKGEVLGITRFGVSKMRESVLMLASFEKTTDHLFDAAVHARTDAIVGVSECIIMGMNVPVGTGLPSLFWKCTK